MELIGNSNTQTQIGLAIKAAIIQDRSVPHMIFAGAAGCGKTSMAKFLANKINTNLIMVGADSLKDRSDVMKLLVKLNKSGYNEEGDRLPEVPRCPSVVFIDEIHNLSLKAQEVLGIVMEEWEIPLDDSEVETDLVHAFTKAYNKYNYIKTKTEAHKRWVPRFTLIGATTNDGKLSKPFRDRFKMLFVFKPYSLSESVDIIKVHADRLGVKLTDGAMHEIANRGRGVPRILVRLIEQCRDFAVGIGEETIDTELAKATFGLIGVDNTGLTGSDIDLMKILFESRAPLGADNIAIRLNKDPKVVVDAIEPYLIQRGLVIRAPKGRMLSLNGLKYLLEHGHIHTNTQTRDFVDIPINKTRKS